METIDSLNSFTNIYSMSKTLRFELKPEEETKKRFDNWIKGIKIEENSAENLIAKDYAIVSAYKALKPILDAIHEEYIKIALQSSKAKEIDFRPFYEEYKNKTKDISKIESDLRSRIGDSFKVAEERFFNDIKTVEPKLKKQKESVLTDRYILSYISKNISNFTTNSLSEDELKKHLKSFEGFFTYFSGYNINRENYYDYKEEKNTAIATRIVNENLPIFCNNSLRFKENEDIYVSIYSFLKNLGIDTKIKDEKGNIVEAEAISEKIFAIEYYNYCLSQPEIEEYNRHIGNANLLINLYSQQNSKLQKYERLPVFEKLRKQIGCGVKKMLFFCLKADKENELSEEERKSDEIFSVEKLLKVTANAGCQVFNSTDGYSVKNFISYLENQSDWNGSYWSDSAVSYISNRYFLNWHELKDKLKDYPRCASYDKKREEPVKLNEAVELSDLFKVIDKESLDSLFKNTVLENYKNIINSSEKPSSNLIKILCSDLQDALSDFNAGRNEVLGLKSYKSISAYSTEDDPTIMQIKDWFDSIKTVLKIVNLFNVKKSKMKGSIANPEMENFIDAILNPENVFWNKWYDGIRNYLTKKPQDDVKENMLKLNFGSSSLLGGWSDGQEKVKISTILKHNENIYLCILKNRYFFDTSKENNLVYKGTGGFRLILRNLKFQTLSGKGFVSKYKQKYSEMGKENPRKAMESLISFIKENYIRKYPALMSVVETKYESKKDFDADIEEKLKECYECKFIPIDWKMVKRAEADGDLFIFKISSKDFKLKSSGKKDLQTLYWESVLSENSPHQLCAGAEIFMRKPIQEEAPVVHKTGDILVNKKFSDNTTIPDDLYLKLLGFVHEITQPVSDGKEVTELLLKSDLAKVYTKEYLAKVVFKIAKFDIVKDRRFYGETKYFFYCPIKLNFVSRSFDAKQISKGIAYNIINPIISDLLSEYQNLHFIGLDRGEKHLVYLCEIDKDCNIKDMHSLNIVNGTNYMMKLEEKAGNRQKARQNWQRIENISNLKEGYISNVVHSITEKVIKEPGYIVLEDLSRKMMQGRQKIEKSVYQKFEVALAKKLNFVVVKNASEGAPGSASAALQFTPPINNFQDIENKRQFGVMLYTRASYTSVTDPVTGWRQTIYLKKGSAETIKRQIIEKFSDIGFDGSDYFFEYIESHAGKKWRMYSGQNGHTLPRFINEKKLQDDKNLWVPVQIDLVEILDHLFSDFDKNQSILEQIRQGKELQKLNNRHGTAWDSLLFVINMIQQIRNSGLTEEDKNFLYSPVRNKNNIHFDTRDHDNTDLPGDADANGAYNIARKGIIMHEHILQWKRDGEKAKDLDLLITDEEWDLWLLDRDKWAEKLSYFASHSLQKSSPKM